MGRRPRKAPLFLSFLLLALAANAQAPLRTIGFLTDFDVKDDAVGICKAVMDGVAPGAKVIDISH